MGLSFQKVASSQSIQSGISIGRKHTEKIKLDTEFCHVNWAKRCLDFGHYLISDAIVPLWTWVSEFRHYCPILDRSFFFLSWYLSFFSFVQTLQEFTRGESKEWTAEALSFLSNKQITCPTLWQSEFICLLIHCSIHIKVVSQSENRQPACNWSMRKHQCPS